MKSILFSAVFGTANRPERVSFLENLQDRLGDRARVVLFNTSGEAHSRLEVIDAARGLGSQADPEAWFESWIAENCPGIAREMTDHVRGEFGKGTGHFRRGLGKLVRMLVTFEAVIARDPPGLVLLWNEFNAFHRCLAIALEREGIPYAFFHDGVLPGSVAIDVEGEMGESPLATDPKGFLSTPVTEGDLARAATFLDWLDGEEVNRHPQLEEVSVAEGLRQAGLRDRPLIFYAGQNDWHAGIKPRSPRRAFHSPFYPGSVEALEALDKAAGALGMAVLFKPHPLSRDRYAFLRADEFPNTLILSSTSMWAAIEESVMVATIASQVGYVSVMRDRPTVMLGRNQLTGKGMTYDLKRADGLEALLRRAYDDPLRSSRRDALVRHVAQLERAYLYDYGTLAEALPEGLFREGSYYRKGPAEAAELLLRLIADGAPKALPARATDEEDTERPGKGSVSPEDLEHA